MSIEEVRALVAERQRYDDWLAALETKRAETPPRVFERVQGDYVARRADVITRLQSHVDGLASLGGTLEQRLTDLEGRLAAHEEELAEGMLRNLVGEFDNDRWDTVRQEVEARIAALSDERGTLVAEVDDVRALLANARQLPEGYVAPGAPAPEAERPLAPTPALNAAVADLAVAEPDLAESAPAEAAPSEASEAAPAGRDVPPEVFVTPLVVAAIPSSEEPASVPLPEPADADAIVFTESVTVQLEPAADLAPADTDDALLDIDVQAMVDNPVPSAPSHEEVLADVAALFDTSSIAAVPEPAGAETPRSPADQSEFDDALAMFGEVSGPADPQFVQSLQGIEPDHERRTEGLPATATPPSAPNTADPFDDLAFLRSVIDQGGANEAAPSVSPSAPPVSGAMPLGAAAGEPQKTLRCTECGTMNLPTEWYCERCGGELAAF